MKTKKQWYIFSEKELEILREVATGSKEFIEIESKLKIKPNLLSYHLKKLEEKELIQLNSTFCRSRNIPGAPGKQVTFTALQHSIQLERLLKEQIFSIKWEKVLSGLGLEVLFGATSCHSQTKLISYPSYWRYCKKLNHFGVLTLTEDGFYSINDFFILLRDFICDYQRYIAEKTSKVVCSESKILWQRGSEFLLQVPKGTSIVQEGFTKTATSVLSQYRIVSLTKFEIYFYSPYTSELSLEDIVLHLLLLQKASAQYSVYCYLLLRKQLKNIDEKFLLEKAKRYDLGFQLSHMLNIVREFRPP